MVLTIYSFSGFNIKIGKFELKKSDIKFALMGDTVKPVGMLAISVDTVRQTPAPMDTTSQRILLIGDSMLEGLMLRMRDYTEFNHHELQPVIWYSSQSEWYGKYDTLRYFIKKYKPTYVMLVLGANELFVPNIMAKRDKYVKRLLSQMDTVRYIWIGPPNWKDDTGINDMILRNVGERRYFPSKKLTYKRFKDGAHPTHESAAMWMDSIASFVMTKSMFPIRLNKPTEKRKKYPSPILLQPLK